MKLRLILVLALLSVFCVSHAQNTGSPYSRGSTIYVSPTGDNANSGSSASPVRTISNAVWRASSGDTVFVRSGTYAENNLAKDGIILAGDVGADVVYIQNTTNEYLGIIDDRGKGPVRMRFDWPGRMIFGTVTNVLLCDTNDLFPDSLNPSSIGAVVHTNPASQYVGNIGELSGLNYQNLQFFILYQSAGSNSSLKIDRMLDISGGAGLDQAPYADPGNNFLAPSVNGWFVGNSYRYAELHCPYMWVTKQSWYWLEQDTAAKTNDFYFYAGYTRGNMYGQAFTDKYKGWVIGGAELDGSTYNQAIGCYGGGKWYFDYQKIFNSGGGIINTEPASGISNGVVYIRAMKAESTSAFATINAGTAILQIDDWVGTGFANGITNKSGTLVQPIYSVSGLTNITAAATSRVIQLPRPMPGTNYTVTFSHSFNPVAIPSVTSQNRSNFTISYSAGVTTGGNIYWQAKQNIQ